MRAILLTLLAITLTGCNSIPQSVGYLNAPKPVVSENEATIVVMRPVHSQVTSPNTVAVDGKNAVAISQGQYSWFQVSPGEHTLTESTPWYHADISGLNENSSSHTIQVQKGKVYYLSFHETMQSVQGGVGISFAGGTPIAYPDFTATYVRYWRVHEPPEGKAQIESMRFVAPHKAMLNK